MSEKAEKKGVKLTDDEAGKAAGGEKGETKTWTLICIGCDTEYTAEFSTMPPCPKCGTVGRMIIKNVSSSFIY